MGIDTHRIRCCAIDVVALIWTSGCTRSEALTPPAQAVPRLVSVPVPDRAKITPCGISPICC
jgi:hypothetical protein